MVLALIIALFLIVVGYALILTSCRRLYKITVEVATEIDKLNKELDELEEELNKIYEEQFMPVLNEVFTHTTDE